MLGNLPPHYGQALLMSLFGDRPLPRGAHAGLVFDRYLRIWREQRLLRELRQEARGERKDEHREALESFCEATARPGESCRELLAMVNDRLDRALGPLRNARCFDLRTNARLAVGTGAEHPLENSLTFDPVVGVPFLPGSTLKGLCRAWAELLCAEGTLGDATLRRLFGPESNERDKSAGDLVFWPAWPNPGPTEWPALEVDVINCHHPEYYGGDRDRAVDWESPVPVYFLVVRAGTAFRFRLSSRSENGEHVALGERLLKEALRWLGLGSKTAVGYGTFAAPPQPEAAGASPSRPAPTRAASVRREAPGTLSLRKQDGRLLAQLADGTSAWALGEQARALVASLPEELRQRLAKGREIGVRVQYQEDGNQRQIVALVPG
ncbi:MAG: type III-B CRISPR module RAMP protein Cmr6 [Myxococcales bacterium]|nr:type III-B CRISPR module RAMP protein Cmr6 [Myxococcota bacterium]MDW8283218.1 type III-B CRISPR module RAMP protein Cmr6 [Myxococcales bacterium]